MPWHKIRHAQQAMRLPNPQSDNGLGWSTLTRAEFEAEDGTLSEIEQLCEEIRRWGEGVV